MAVSKRLRYEILRRDNHACRYCGGTAPDVALTVDHVIPSALGGTDEPSNLVAACQPCNAGKSASAPDAPIVEDVKQDALRWARAMAYAASEMYHDAENRRQWLKEFTALWDGWKLAGEPLPRPSDWQGSVDTFRESGVQFWMLDEALDIAMRKPGVYSENVWRYFCGVVWRMADEQRKRASVLEGGQ